MQPIKRTLVERLLIHENTCIQKHTGIHFHVSDIRNKSWSIYSLPTTYIVPPIELSPKDKILKFKTLQQTLASKIYMIPNHLILAIFLTRI